MTRNSIGVKSKESKESKESNESKEFKEFKVSINPYIP